MRTLREAVAIAVFLFAANLIHMLGTGALVAFALTLEQREDGVIVVERESGETCVYQPPICHGADGAAIPRRSDEGEGMRGWAELGGMVERAREAEARADAAEADGMLVRGARWVESLGGGEEGEE